MRKWSHQAEFSQFAADEKKAENNADVKQISSLFQNDADAEQIFNLFRHSLKKYAATNNPDIISETEHSVKKYG